jgi:uncharacterized protein (TIGR00296 family)
MQNDFVYQKKCGVFVTLNTHDKGKYGLRGCIGLPYPIKPLVEAVKEAAESAAFKDPRFLPVCANEIENITIEVSVLTPPKIIHADDPNDYQSQVLVGRDGLIIGKGWKRGLLLPQVPIDWGWDSAEFLSQCCVKAGLPKDEWRKGGIEVYSFQAFLFKEHKPEGKVIRHQIN